MKMHRMTPEELAIYRERKTAGCYNCKNQQLSKLKPIVRCIIEESYRLKLDYPNATRDTCKHYRPKEKK